jgi:hypothetical protein
MIVIPGGEAATMAKKKKAVSPAEDERVTLLNLKGSEAERNYLRSLSQITGVPASEIARRGMAMWAKKRGVLAPPADWVGG